MKRRAILRSLPAAVAVPALASADRGLAARRPAGRRPSPPSRSAWSSAASAGRPTTRCWRSSSATGSSTSAARPPGGEDAEGPWTPDALPRLKERCDKAGRRARHDPVPVHVVLARRSREAARHHARPGARARAGARGGGGDHPPMRRASAFRPSSTTCRCSACCGRRPRPAAAARATAPGASTRSRIRRR